nr:unnamed protein product [Trichobilharzia regenti]
MVRRPSFSISDDHQSTSTELSYFPLQNVLEETNLQFKNAREPIELPSLSKSDSSPYATSLFESNSANPLLDIMHTCKMHNTSTGCISSPSLKNVDYLSPSSLLSSALIKLYLSRVTVYSSNNTLKSHLSSGSEEAKFHCTNCQNLVGLPGCLQIASNLLASMVMPAKHFIGVYSNNNNKSRNKLNLGNVYSSNGIFNVSSFVSSCPSDKDVYTDVSYSSSAESVSTWEDASNVSNAGYYSDNYLIGALNEVKKCDVYRRCLEMKLRHTPSPARIPTFTDGNLRSTSAYIGSSSHRQQHPHNHHHHRHHYHHHHHGSHHRKLALTDIYAGLKLSSSPLSGKDGKSSMNSPSSSSTSHDTSRNNNNNNNVDVKSNSTNSDTITSQSSILSAYEYSLSSTALERLCSLWINLKPDIIEEEKFYYMDEKSLERRVNAQASNIISPVSF